MRTARSLLVTGAVVVLALVVLIAGAAIWLESGGARRLLEDRSSAMLDRPVEVGAVEFAGVLPPAVVLHDVRIANADWAGDQPFLEVPRMEVAVAPAPALGGALEFVRVSATEPVVRIARNEAGEGNWPEPDGPEGQPLPPLSAHDVRLRYTSPAWPEGRELTLAEVSIEGTETPAYLRLAADGNDRITLSASRNITPAVTGGGDLPIRVAVEHPGGAIRYRGQAATDPLQADGELAVKLERPGDFFAAFGFEGLPIPTVDLTADVSAADGRGTLAVESGRVDGRPVSGDIAFGESDGRFRVDADLALASWPLPAPALCRGGEPGEGELPTDPLDPLPDLTVVLEITVEQLECEQFATGQLDTQLRWTGDRLYFDLRRLEVLGGAIGGKGELGPTEDSPAVLSAEGRVEGIRIDAAPALSDFDDVAARVHGRYELSGTIANPLETLDGQLVLVMYDGMIPRSLVERATLDLGSILVEGNADPAEIHCAITDLRFDQGIARIETFVMLAAEATIVADGRVNLREDRFEITFQADSETVAFFEISSPIRIAGPFSSPRIQVAEALAEGGIKALLSGVAPAAAALFSGVGLAAEDHPECSRITSD